MKQKHYVCFVCYKFHPEMRGLSEEEFLAGENICKQEKCTRKGQPLESAFICGVCTKLYPVTETHKHD